MADSDQSTIETLRWIGEPDNHLVIIDQTRLPTELVEIELPDIAVVWEAIKSLRIRARPPSASPRPTASTSVCRRSATLMKTIFFSGFMR